MGYNVIKKTTYENHLDASVARWFAVYTRYKREKLVKKMLEDKGIEAYLPLQKKTRQYIRKIKTVELPLINCYVFVKIVKDQYIGVLETENVLRFVRFSQNIVAIPDREMEVMRRVVGEGIPIEVEVSAFVPGDAVEIIGGNLTGLRGKLVEKHNKKRFVVDLDVIGHSLIMEIDPRLLRRI
jgi:transcription antitermination factor NusG